MSRFDPSSRKTSEAQTLALMAVSMTLVCGGFYQAYQMGASGQEGLSPEMLSAKVAAQQGLRKQLDACHSDIKDTEKALGVIVRLSSTMQKEQVKLEAENARLADTQADYEQKIQECTEMREARHLDWSDEDKKNAAATKKLVEQQKALNDAIHRSRHGKGTRDFLLDASMQRFVAENAHLREGLEMGPQNITEEYLEYLLSKHGDITEEQLLKIEKESEASYEEAKKPGKSGVVVDKYDRSRDMSQNMIFFPVKRDGRYSHPQWRDFVGTQPLRKGTQTRDYVHHTSIYYAATGITSLGICASASNADHGFMLPTHISVPGGPLHRLDVLFDTPMVQFCQSCRLHEEDEVFDLACKGRTVEDVYGSMLHWRVRSRVRFNETVYELADEIIREYSLDSGLTVRVPGMLTEQICKREPQATLAYEKLLRPMGSKGLAGDAHEACNPSLAFIAKKINSFIAKTSVTSVHLSTDLTGAALQPLLSAIDSDVSVHYFLEPSDHFLRDAVDLVVGSKSKYLIANRYDLASQQMIEGFVLEHSLSIKGISVW